MPGEQEKVDESGSLSEKPGELAGLHQWTANGYLLRKRGLDEKILEAEVTGKRARGRQIVEILDWMMGRWSAKMENSKTRMEKIGKDRERVYHHNSFVYCIQCQNIKEAVLSKNTRITNTESKISQANRKPTLKAMKAEGVCRAA